MLPFRSVCDTPAMKTSALLRHQPCQILPLLFLTLLLLQQCATATLDKIVLNTLEGVPVGTKLGMLPSVGDTPRQSAYMIASDDDESPFRIDRDGSVLVARPIDLESLCAEMQECCSHSTPCELQTTIIDRVNSERIQSIQLRVRILDVNDHAPRFPNPEGQTVAISEKAPVGSLVGIEHALDNDWSLDNQIQNYVLHGDQLRQFFEIYTPSPRDFQLRLREPLDYERQRSFTGSLEACDPQNCSSTPLTINVIDVNDNLPTFLPPFVHNLTIPEDLDMGASIIRLNASDPDSPPNAQMRFEFVPSEDASAQATFRLDDRTGVVTLAKKLRAHVRQKYSFKVRVKESSESARSSEFHQQASLFSFPISNAGPRSDTVDIIVNVLDINDFAPEIFLIDSMEEDGDAITVPENTDATLILTLRVRDRDLGDNGEVSCALDDSNDVGYKFRLHREPNPSLYTLHTRRRFDAEVEPAIILNITCWDSGIPQQSTSRRIVVRIGDENEYSPIFNKQEYTAAVVENARANQPVLQVLATDQDQSAQLTYCLKGDGERYFKIDPDTGMIITIGGGEHESSRLDREMTPAITFDVLVQDVRRTVGLQDDDKRLRFSNNTSIPELMINTAQATVRIKVLDENDNEPTFTSVGPFYLPENHSKYTKVNGHLNAVDPDEGLNGTVKYTLQDVWDSSTGSRKHNIFRMDEITGELQALEELDREQVAEYTLRIAACDMAQRDSRCTRLNVTVSVIDVNDNEPEWLFPVGHDEVVNVTADAAPGQVIAQLVAHDRDAGQNGRVRYALHDPHSQVAFTVNSSTGQITVVDRYAYLPPAEAGGSAALPKSIAAPPSLYPGVYKLRIRASDLGHPPLYSDTWLTVRVVEVNSGIFGIQTGLLTLLVLVTAIIAICLTVAIICVRRRSKHPRHCKPCCYKEDNTERGSIANQNCPRMTYILPQDHQNTFLEYPTFTSTFMKHSAMAPSYTIVSQKAPTAGSVCSADHCNGSCPMGDIGVGEFYAPYHKQSSTEVFMPQDMTLTPEQMRLLESRVQEMGDTGSPSGSYLSFVKPDLPSEEKNSQPLKYSTCYPTVPQTGQLSPSVRFLGYPTYSACEANSALLKFQQVPDSPGMHYCKRSEEGVQEMFEAREGVRLSGLPTSEQFEGGSADSGRGVSEDEPQPQFSRTGGIPPENAFVLSYPASSFDVSTFSGSPAPPTSSFTTNPTSFLKRANYPTSET